MNKVKDGVVRIARVFGILFALTSIAAYVAFLQGIRMPFLPIWTSGQGLLDSLFNLPMLVVNVFFMLSVCLNMYDKRIIKHVAILVCIVGVSYTMCYYFELPVVIATGSVPFAYAMAYATIHKKSMRLVTTTIGYSICVIVYQAISIPVKIGVVRIGYNAVSPLELALFSIDMYLFYALIYVWKGGDSNAVDFAGLHIFDSEAFIAATESDEEITERMVLESEYKKMPWFKRMRVIVRFFSMQVAQLIVVVGICRLSSDILTIAILLVSFYVFGQVIRNRWHSNSILVCTLTSATMFFIACRLTIPLQYSLFFSFVIAFLMVYALYRVQKHVDHDNEMNRKIKKMESIPIFECKTATSEEIMIRARLRGISDEDAAFVYRAFRTKTSIKEFADEYCVSEQAIKKRKQRLKRIMES